MLAYFDTNIYSFVRATGEVEELKQFLAVNNINVQASSTNYFEILHIPNPEIRSLEMGVLTTIASSFELKPQSWYQAMEVLGEIKTYCPYWLRKPISNTLLKKSKYFLDADKKNWEEAKRQTAIQMPSWNLYKDIVESGVIVSRENQRRMKYAFNLNDPDYSIVRKTAGGKIEKIPSWNLKDPEIYWRAESAIAWFQAIQNRNPASRDYADWLDPYVKEDSFKSPTYSSFWMEKVRVKKMQKNRITGLVEYYQLKHKITHGNSSDQMHACNYLVTDCFLTADKAFYVALSDSIKHFTHPARIILVDRGSKSAINEIKKILA